MFSTTMIAHRTTAMFSQLSLRTVCVNALHTTTTTTHPTTTTTKKATTLESSNTIPIEPPARASSAAKSDYMMFHPQYDLNLVETVSPSHRPPDGVRDWLSYSAVLFARTTFDTITGYKPQKVLPLDMWLQRFIFLETVAGVPGMVGAMMRHMMSLRTLQRDHGWIHTLLEEAENERMHLLTFLKMRQPGMAFRLGVLVTQGIFFNAFFIAYLFTPRTCHRFVGYLEEEAVRTYTHALRDIDTPGSEAAVWATTPAPGVAIRYWKLAEDATVRDVIVAVRADEASHAHVNHTLGGMGVLQDNPFVKGHTELPKNFVDPPEGFVPEHDAHRTRAHSSEK
eukprot:m.207194 g.207194  ORF g.207194 m.207194 type:complete len:338 (-) comp32977_c0_seq1:297-1310(-)